MYIPLPNIYTYTFSHRISTTPQKENEGETDREKKKTHPAMPSDSEMCFWLLFGVDVYTQGKIAWHLQYRIAVYFLKHRIPSNR